jgi:hypothetical protein
MPKQKECRQAVGSLAGEKSEQNDKLEPIPTSPSIARKDASSSVLSPYTCGDVQHRSQIPVNCR